MPDARLELIQLAEQMRADVRRITGIDDPYLEFGDSRAEKVRRIEQHIKRIQSENYRILSQLLLKAALTNPAP
jgi:hypothetical protein